MKKKATHDLNDFETHDRFIHTQDAPHLLLYQQLDDNESAATLNRNTSADALLFPLQENHPVPPQEPVDLGAGKASNAVNPPCKVFLKTNQDLTEVVKAYPEHCDFYQQSDLTLTKPVRLKKGQRLISVTFLTGSSENNLHPASQEQAKNNGTITEPVQLSRNVTGSVDEEDREGEDQRPTAPSTNTLFLQKPLIFRMIPVLILHPKTGTSRVSYRVQTEHWQQQASQDIADYPTIHVADSFEGGQLFELSAGSGLFGLVVNIQSMPLNKELFCHLIITSHSLKVRLNGLLIAGGTPCDATLNPSMTAGTYLLDNQGHRPRMAMNKDQASKKRRGYADSSKTDSTGTTGSSVGRGRTPSQSQSRDGREPPDREQQESLLQERPQQEVTIDVLRSLANFVTITNLEEEERRAFLIKLMQWADTNRPGQRANYLWALKQFLGLGSTAIPHLKDSMGMAKATELAFAHLDEINTQEELAAEPQTYKNTVAAWQAFLGDIFGNLQTDEALQLIGHLLQPEGQPNVNWYLSDGRHIPHETIRTLQPMQPVQQPVGWRSRLRPSSRQRKEASSPVPTDFQKWTFLMAIELNQHGPTSPASVNNPPQQIRRPRSAEQAVRQGSPDERQFSSSVNLPARTSPLPPPPQFKPPPPPVTPVSSPLLSSYSASGGAAVSPAPTRPRSSSFTTASRHRHQAPSLRTPLLLSGGSRKLSEPGQPSPLTTNQRIGPVRVPPGKALVHIPGQPAKTTALTRYTPLNTFPGPANEYQPTNTASRRPASSQATRDQGDYAVPPPARPIPPLHASGSVVRRQIDARAQAREMDYAIPIPSASPKKTPAPGGTTYAAPLTPEQSYATPRPSWSKPQSNEQRPVTAVSLRLLSDSDSRAASGLSMRSSLASGDLDLSGSHESLPAFSPDAEDQEKSQEESSSNDNESGSAGVRPQTPAPNENTDSDLSEFDDLLSTFPDTEADMNPQENSPGGIESAPEIRSPAPAPESEPEPEESILHEDSEFEELLTLFPPNADDAEPQEGSGRKSGSPDVRPRPPGRNVSP